MQFLVATDILISFGVLLTMRKNNNVGIIRIKQSAYSSCQGSSIRFQLDQDRVSRQDNPSSECEDRIFCQALIILVKMRKSNNPISLLAHPLFNNMQFHIRYHIYFGCSLNHDIILILFTLIIEAKPFKLYRV